VIKRAMDVVLAAAGLVIAAPLAALIALAIKLESPGGVIFSQQRLGKGGRPFSLHKFRKFPDSWGTAGPGVTVAGDARMTRVGRFLERTKLDELPQLWNILRGEMSLVGPRPESLRYADLFQGELREVLDYVPGVFGPNQIAFRNESAMYPPDQDPEVFYRTVLFPQKAKADIAYFRTASVMSDFAWIVRGVWASLVGVVDWRRSVGLHGPILLVDLLAIESAWILANLVRFEGLPSGTNWPAFLTGLWLLPALILPVAILAGVYRHPVRYFSLPDAWRLMVGSTLGWTIGSLLLIGLWHRQTSIFLAPFGFLVCLSVTLGARLWRREWWRKEARSRHPDQFIHILVYGAGRRGNALVSFLDNVFPYARVIGFLDDDIKFLLGRVVLGRRVLGSERDLSTVHAAHTVDQLWVTFEPDKHKLSRLEQWCLTNEVKLIVLPTTAPFDALFSPASEYSEMQPGLAAQSLGQRMPEKLMRSRVH